MKPAAPAEYRGQFTPIRTSAAGVEICEHMPQLARRADRYALIRGITHNLAEHNLGTSYLMTGNRPTPVRAESGAATSGDRGHAVVRWTQGGMVFWAASDLNAAELTDFARLFAERAAAPSPPPS